MVRQQLGWCFALCLSAACTEQRAVTATTATTSTASAPGFTRAVEPGEAAATSSPLGNAASSAAGSAGAPAPEADGGAAAPAASGTAAANAPPSSNAPLPEVEITNYGMHIGGGPNDAKTKAPIKDAVMKQRDAFRACFALAEDKTKPGTFGVDIRIPAAGGLAKISKPKSGLKGPAVEECMVKVFESVEFARPPKGVPMNLSYSLRFVPKKAP